MAGKKINYSNIGVAGGDQTIQGDFLVGCTTTELQNPIIHKTKVGTAHNSQVGGFGNTQTNQTHQPQAKAEKTQSHPIIVCVGDRKIKVSLPIGRCTGKDLRGKLKDTIDNIENAIFKERDEDGDMVEILDSEDLSNTAKIFVEFKQTNEKPPASESSTRKKETYKRIGCAGGDLKVGGDVITGSKGGDADKSFEEIATAEKDAEIVGEIITN